MSLGFAIILRLVPRPTNVGIKETNSTYLQMYSMTTMGFWVYDSRGKIWFFEKTFFLTNTSMKIVLEMFFLFFSNTDLEFNAKKLI